MALKIDNTRGFRSYAELSRLIQAVLDCDDPGAEHHAIEWKGSIDLASAEGSFVAARAIVAFANRTELNAKRHFEGLAYLLLGIEPSKVTGVERWDGEKLQPKLATYLGSDGPTWHHDNITIDGKNVIAITVEAPRPGDQIHTIRKAFTPADRKTAARDGEIFVRRSSKSERANTAEIRDLERRLLAGGGAIAEIEVMADYVDSVQPVIFPIDLTQPSIDEWIEAERQIVRRLEDVKPKSAIEAVWATTPLDSRSQSEFDNEVEEYLNQMRKKIVRRAKGRAFKILEERHCALQFKNPTDFAIEDIEVRVVLPKGIDPVFSAPDLDLPSRPVSMGKQTLVDRYGLRIHAVPKIARQDMWIPAIEHVEGRAQFSFTPFALHAGRATKLDAFALVGIATLDLTGTFSLEIEITAKNRRGVMRRELPAIIGPKTYALIDLMRPI